jgi:TonB family protein
MAALLAFADADAGASPALAFLRTRQLRSRLRQLAQEATMSRSRLGATVVALMAVLAGSALAAARALPLEVQLQAAQAGARLEIRLAEAAPGAGLVEVAVPDGLEPVYVHGDAILTGEDVRTARVVERSPSQFDVAVTFSEAAAARVAAATRAHVGKPIAILLDSRVISAPVLRAPIGEAAVINGIFTADQARALAESLAPGTALGAVAVRPGPVVPPRLLHVVRPQYTPAGMLARIQGTVVLDAIVNTNGGVSDVRVVRSLAREHGLDEEAVRTVKQWQFEPGTWNGTPVTVLVRLEVDFTLPESR